MKWAEDVICGNLSCLEVPKGLVVDVLKEARLESIGSEDRMVLKEVVILAGLELSTASVHRDE